MVRNRIKFLSVAIIFLACLNVVAQSHHSQDQRTPQYKITALKAMLFYDNNGTFSRDVVEEETGTFLAPSILWNTTMEGASREGASTSTLVTVEVTGDYGSETARRIELVAKYKKIDGPREILVRQLSPIYIRENGKYVAGFWLNETGCNPVRLTARVIGQPQSSLMRRIIKFGCGE